MISIRNIILRYVCGFSTYYRGTKIIGTKLFNKGWVNPRRPNSTIINNNSNNSNIHAPLNYGNNNNIPAPQNNRRNEEISPSPTGFMKRFSLNFPLKNEEIKNISDVASKGNPKYRKQLQKYFRIPPDQLVDRLFSSLTFQYLFIQPL